jgi:hypothetical protein
MYMREMGTVELLTREGEIDIAKRIEDGINQVQSSVAEYPEAITYLLDQYDKHEAGQIRLGDIISGFVNLDEDDLPPTATHIGSELSEEELADEDEDDDEEEEGDGDDDSDHTVVPEDLNSLLKIAEAIAELREAIKEDGGKVDTIKEELKATVGTELDDIREYLKTLDYQSLTAVSKELHRFLATREPDTDSIDTFPELLDFLAGFNVRNKQYENNYQQAPRLAVADLYTLSNSRDPLVSSNYFYKLRHVNY